MTFSKTINTILIVVAAMLSPFLLYNLDWKNGYFLPIALLMTIMVLVMAVINFENLILGLIILLPTIYNYNYIKINVFNFLPGNDLELYLNPASVIYVLIVLFGIMTIIENRHKLKNLPLRIILLLNFIWIGASIFWSDNKEISIIELIYFLVPFSLYIISYCYFNTSKAFIKITLAAVFSSIIPLLFSFKQIINNEYFYEADSSLGRLTSTMTHPNSLGLYLVLIIGLITAYYLAKENRKISQNKTLFIYGFLLLAILIMTYSRTAWFCLAAFFLLFLLAEKKILQFILIFSPFAIYMMFMIESIKIRIFEIFDSAIFNSITARENIWRVAWSKITEKPLIGYGVGNSESVIENAKDWQGGMSLPHNDYLLQTLELGLVGLLLFIAYTYGAIYHIVKSFNSLSAKYIKINSKNFNFKMLSFGILAIYLALIPSTFLESLSQKILIQIILWSLLGSLFALKKTAPQQ